MRVARSSRPAAPRGASVSPPEHRTVSTLRSRAEFDRVFRSGRRQRIGGIVAIVAPGGSEGFRFGLVAGKRIGGAVERNRAKRRIRHALGSVSPPGEIDLIVIASSSVLTAPFPELVRWLSQAVEPRVEQLINQEKPAP